MPLRCQIKNQVAPSMEILVAHPIEDRSLARSFASNHQARSALLGEVGGPGLNEIPPERNDLILCRQVA